MSVNLGIPAVRYTVLSLPFFVLPVAVPFSYLTCSVKIGMRSNNRCNTVQKLSVSARSAILVLLLLVQCVTAFV